MKWIDNRAFTLPLEYILCTSEKKFRKALKQTGIASWKTEEFIPNGYGAAAHSYESDDGRKKVIVAFGEHSEFSKIEVYALLVHEAIHIWQEVKLMMREKEPSSEFEAYTIQQISQNLMYSYEDQMKKKDAKA